MGHPLKNKKLYKQALVHKSFNKTKNNERLEFLGDAVLSSVVSETLYNLDLSESEGILSSKRALIISRKNLNNIAKEILDEKYLIHKTKRISENMYGNYLEAIIGALYLDQGLKRTERFIKDKILDRPRLNKEHQKDFKSKLITWSNNEKNKINFIVLDSLGPDHKKKYNIAFLLNGEIIKTYWAYSIKEGEQALAKIIYKEIDERNSLARRN